MPRITDIVKHLIILNVLFYLGSRALLGAPGYSQLALYYPLSEHFQPFQVVTHMFMHGDVNHIFFNMLGLLFLGPAVEQAWQNKKFLFYYLICGFGAMLAHMAEWYFQFSQLGAAEFNAWMNSSQVYVLGASGAVNGVVMAFAYLFPNRELHLIFPPIAIKAKYLAALYLMGDLYLGLSGQHTGTAHFAHIGGALTGLAIMYYWRQRGKLFNAQM